MTDSGEHTSGRSEAAGAEDAPRRRLAEFAPAACLAILLGFNLPVVLFVRNRDFVEAPALAILSIGAAAACAIALILAAITLPWAERVRDRIIGLVAGLGALCVFHNLLPLGTDQLLDGRELEFHFEPVCYAASVAATLVLPVLFFVGYRRWKRPVQLAASVLALSFVVAPLLQLWGTQEASKARKGATLEDITGLSPERNILMILMDSLQSDVLLDLIVGDAELEQALEGFVFYEDTLGAAATTYMTMPAMLTGTSYDGRLPPREFFVDRIVSNSFLTELARGGWHVTHVNPMVRCEAEIAECLYSSTLIGPSWLRALRDFALLFDMGLLNSSPYPAREDIYQRGSWVVSRFFDASTHKDLEDSVRFIELFTSKLELTADAPTFKLVHLMNTHPPFALDARCRPSGYQKTNEAYREQVRCGVRLFLDLIGHLQDLEIYDDSAVILISDTGLTTGWQQPHLAAVAAGASTSEAKLIANASPALMVKRPGARGGFRRSRAPVHLSDVPDAVCEIAGVCARRFGRSLFEVREGDPRKRRYVDYKWKAEYWKSERIPMIKFYDITGPAHLPASWMLIERVEP